jgi:segregation and condensation protein B
LQRLGLNSVTELPALAPFLPDLEALDDIIATLTD